MGESLSLPETVLSWIWSPGAGEGGVSCRSLDPWGSEGGEALWLLVLSGSDSPETQGRLEPLSPPTDGVSGASAVTLGLL